MCREIALLPPPVLSREQSLNQVPVVYGVYMACRYSLVGRVLGRVVRRDRTGTARRRPATAGNGKSCWRAIDWTVHIRTVRSLLSRSCCCRPLLFVNDGCRLPRWSTLRIVGCCSHCRWTVARPCIRKTHTKNLNDFETHTQTHTGFLPVTASVSGATVLAKQNTTRRRNKIVDQQAG